MEPRSKNSGAVPDRIIVEIDRDVLDYLRERPRHQLTEAEVREWKKTIRWVCLALGLGFLLD